MRAFLFLGPAPWNEGTASAGPLGTKRADRSEERFGIWVDHRPLPFEAALYSCLSAIRGAQTHPLTMVEHPGDRRPVGSAVPLAGRQVR